MAWRVGEILIQKKFITWEQLHDALEDQQITHELTGQILIRKGYVSEHLFYQALAEQHHMRFVDLTRVRINPKAIAYVPKSVAEKYLVLPVDVSSQILHVAINDPTFGWPENELIKLTGFTEIKPVLALPGALKVAIREQYENENHQRAS